MPNQERTRDPEQQAFAERIWGAIDELRDAVIEIAYHDEPTTPDLRDQIGTAVEDLVRIATEERWRRRTSKALAGRFLVSVGDVISRAMRQLRDAAGLTQQQVADLMGRAGFVNWKRITVAECESGKRAVSTEELIAVAALFDVPVCYLLTALAADEVLEVNERLTLTAAQAQELIADERVEDGWLGIRLSPTISGPIVLGDDEADPWRPSVWESPWVHESENEVMVLRVEAGLFGERRERFFEG
jgi:transcriptional regulator with XRE-family HTH domain